LGIARGDSQIDTVPARRLSGRDRKEQRQQQRGNGKEAAHRTQGQDISPILTYER
jgi:hypothetical protein